jgi:hypothetical protein
VKVGVLRRSTDRKVGNDVSGRIEINTRLTRIPLQDHFLPVRGDLAGHETRGNVGRIGSGREHTGGGGSFPALGGGVKSQITPHVATN